MPSIRPLATLAALAVALLALAPARGAAQIPDTFTNLEVLPRDIPRDSLIQVMRGFSPALGVRCSHCHAEVEGKMDFAADEKVAKEKARFMMRMTADLNRRVLPELPARHEPPVPVGCITCHRGSPLPRTIDRVVDETIREEGIEAAVARYRELRAEGAERLDGRYDFSEGPVNELARRLAATGRAEEAITLLEMNGELHPGSAGIDVQLGDLYRDRGDRERAIVRYRMALEKAPDNQAARRRLQELGVTVPPR